MSFFKKIFSFIKSSPNKKKRKTLQLEIMNINQDYSGVDFHSPTERQLAYAKDLGIIVPNWASKRDVSMLISRAVDDDDFSAPNPELIDFAISKNIKFSRCAGKKQFYNLVFEGLSDSDKVSFFAFSLYRWLSGDRHGNLETFSSKKEFYDFAAEFIEDKSFMNSLKRYKGMDLRFFGEMTAPSGYTLNGGSTGTIAYKKTASFLKDKFSTPLKRSSF